MLKPSEIKATEFDISVLGGYKRESVDDFFNTLSSDYEKLYTENSELAQKLQVCIEKIEEYQKDEHFLKAAIINAEKLNENALKDIEEREKEIEQLAKERAENIVEKAKIEAENIVKNARLEAAESIKACELDTSAKISSLNAQVSAETEKLAAIKKEVSDFKESVLKLYKSHLDSLSKIPEYTHANDIEDKAVSKQSDNTEPETQTEKEKAVTEEKHVLEPIRLDDNKESVKDANEQTAEFVIDKKPAQKEKEDTFEKNFKFQGLKFGADFDIRNDK